MASARAVGPGETQIELDRRMIGESIKRTKERLAKGQTAAPDPAAPARSARLPSPSRWWATPTRASRTLFNALVKARAYAADQLFATLDTTTRQLYLGDKEGAGARCRLSDTVGFIRDLPHGLIDAFEGHLAGSG